MANEIKRHFYNGQHYFLDKENKTVTLTPAFHEQLLNKKLWGRFGFKKIGGSSIGDVLKVDQWKSEFAAFCRMAWLGLPILDRKYVDAGIAIEPKVVNLIESKTGRKVTTYDPMKYNFDFFADKHDIVGGLPDGYIEETKTIIEIKTTGEKNLSKWQQWGIPAGYLKQAQLYAYLMGVSNYSIVATFLKEEDYAKPERYPIEERRTKNWNFKVNEAEAIDDIKFVSEWYKTYTASGASPQYDEKADAELLEWLDISNEQEWSQLKQKWINEGKLVI